jgi:triosephosphate isomerase
MASNERRPIMAGNWKMHHTHLDAIQVVQKLSYRLEDRDYKECEIVVCPSFTALRSVQTVLEADRIPILLGAQNVHWKDQGAYTGEVSPPMLAKLNVRYVIVGHSERRQLFGETDEEVNLKHKAVIKHEMTPIVCVGESLEERDTGRTDERVDSQTRAAFAGVRSGAAAASVVAYEPIWCIGTGRNATPEDANATIAVIRAALRDIYNAETAATIRILYGGSVKPGNIADLMAMPEIDGALVGGASLDPDEFARVVRFRVLGLCYRFRLNERERPPVLNAVLLVLDVIACSLLILFVLLHAGRGGGLSDMFGGQMGGSMAGSTVVERNLDRITVVTAIVFTFSTVLLALRV